MINSAITWWSTIDGQVVFAVIVAVVFTVAFFWSKYQIRKLDREIAEILDRANARRTGGGGGGGSPVTTPPAEVIAAPYKYVISFVDARTDAPITDALTVQFTGPAVDSGEVVDSSNSSVKGKTYTTVNGLITAAANFNGSDDVFSVLGGNLVKGWNTSGVQILRETSKLGDQILTVRLNNNNNAAATNPSSESRRVRRGCGCRSSVRPQPA